MRHSKIAQNFSIRIEIVKAGQMQQYLTPDWDVSWEFQDAYSIPLKTHLNPEWPPRIEISRRVFNSAMNDFERGIPFFF